MKRVALALLTATSLASGAHAVGLSTTAGPEFGRDATNKQFSVRHAAAGTAVPRNDNRLGSAFIAAQQGGLPVANGLVGPMALPIAPNVPSVLTAPSVTGNHFYTDLGAPYPSILRLGDRATMGCTSADNMGGTSGTFSWAAGAPYNDAYLERDAALSACSQSGVAITGLSRTSDSTLGFPQKSAFGFNALAVANVPASVAEGAYFEAWSTALATGTYGQSNYVPPSAAYVLEGNAVNTTGPVMTNSYQLNPPGGAYGVMMGAGGDPGNGATVYSSQWGAGCIANKTTWDHCLVVGAGALTMNSSGIADAILLGKGHQMAWDFDNTGIHSAFIRSDGMAAGLGLVFNETGLTVQNNRGTLVATFTTPAADAPSGGLSINGQVYGRSVVTNSLAVYGSAVVTGVFNVASNIVAVGGLTGASARTLPITVDRLGACTSAQEGTRMAVTDAASSTPGALLIGGGGNHMPAYCNGSAWVAF